MKFVVKTSSEMRKFLFLYEETDDDLALEVLENEDQIFEILTKANGTVKQNGFESSETTPLVSKSGGVLLEVANVKYPIDDASNLLAELVPGFPSVNAYRNSKTYEHISSGYMSSKPQNPHHNLIKTQNVSSVQFSFDELRLNTAYLVRASLRGVSDLSASVPRTQRFDTEGEAHGVRRYFTFQQIYKQLNGTTAEDVYSINDSYSLYRRYDWGYKAEKKVVRYSPSVSIKADTKMLMISRLGISAKAVAIGSSTGYTQSTLPILKKPQPQIGQPVGKLKTAIIPFFNTEKDEFEIAILREGIDFSSPDYEEEGKPSTIHWNAAATAAIQYEIPSRNI